MNADVPILSIKERARKVDRYVGVRMRMLRKLRRVSLIRLSEKVGATGPQLVKYENGENRVSAGKLYIVAKELDVDIGFFFRGYSEECDVDPLTDFIRGE